MSSLPNKIAVVALSLAVLAGWSTPLRAGDYVTLGDLDYANWITREPKSLIVDFETACHAIEDQLRSEGRDFYGDGCVSQLYTAAQFIHIADGYLKKHFPPDAEVFAKRAVVHQRYQKVIDEVIAKEIAAGRGKTAEENANLIYTLVVTISKDIVADYYHNVIEDPEEAKSGYLLAGAEDGKRVYRQNGYAELYRELKLDPPPPASGQAAAAD